MSDVVSSGSIQWPMARTGDHDLRHINHLPKHDHGVYFCLGCGEQLAPVRGAERAWHFRHVEGGGCSEGVRHAYTKWRLARALRLDNLLEVVDVERGLRGRRPDIILDQRLAIELVDTHPPEPESLDAFGEDLVVVELTWLSDADVFDGILLALQLLGGVRDWQERQRNQQRETYRVLQECTERRRAELKRVGRELDSVLQQIETYEVDIADIRRTAQPIWHGSNTKLDDGNWGAWLEDQHPNPSDYCLLVARGGGMGTRMLDQRMAHFEKADGTYAERWRVGYNPDNPEHTAVVGKGRSRRKVAE